MVLPPPPPRRPARRAAAAALLVALAAAAPGCSCGGAVATPEATPPSPAVEPPAPGAPDLAPAPPASAAAPRGPFLKGQLHAHSNASGDSDTPPADVAAWYARRGFDFLVFTDHNRVTDTPDPPGLLTLPGVELTQNLRDCDPPPEPGLACLLHVNALFVAQGRPPALPPADPTPRRLDLYGRAVDVARALGGVAQLNHPNFHWGADAETIVALSRRGLLLVEIANEAVDSANDGDARHPSTEALWDAALSRGARVFATATDDAHHYDDAPAARARGETAYVGDRGFVMVRATKDPASIRAAVEAGDFYATTGVLLDHLEMRPESLAVDVRGGDEATRLEVIGQGGALLAKARGARLRFDPRTAPPGYVRVRVRDDAGRRAWTQPVWTAPPAPAGAPPRAP